MLSKIKTLIDSANAKANTKARIATGSYTGTGTSGASNPNSLTLEFPPKFLVVVSTKDYRLFLIQGMKFANSVDGGNYNAKLRVTWNSNTVSWYTDTYGAEAIYQLNSLNEQYFYIAIG